MAGDWNPEKPQPPPLPEPFRVADTPPSGTPTLVGLQRPVLPPPLPARLSVETDADTPGPKEMARLIRGLRQDLVLLRDTLPQQLAAVVQGAVQSGGGAPSVPVTPVPPSRKQAATQVVTNAAKWTTIAVGVLGIAAQIASQFKPGLVGPIQTVIQLLGGTP